MQDSLKRAVDILLSLVLLACVAPALAVISLLIRRDSGPVFYRGVRVGRHGVHFRILKLRTMVPNAEEIGSDSTSLDDSRQTPTGRWLRHFKIDELPQLVNVLRGEMSLVGPRPQVPRDVARYTDEERVLLSVRPGITDYASIRYRDEGQLLSGRRDVDAAYDELIRPGKIALGLLYVRTRSLRVDCVVLILTLLAIFSHKWATRMLPDQEQVFSTAA